MGVLPSSEAPPPELLEDPSLDKDMLSEAPLTFPPVPPSSEAPPPELLEDPSLDKDMLPVEAELLLVETPSFLEKEELLPEETPLLLVDLAELSTPEMLFLQDKLSLERE